MHLFWQEGGDEGEDDDEAVNCLDGLAQEGQPVPDQPDADLPDEDREEY